ncbi:MAG: dienelactone hydrolase family protein [Bacteroidota bacterium]
MKNAILGLISVMLLTISCVEKEKKKEATEAMAKEVVNEIMVKGQEVTYMVDSLSMNGYIAFDENKTAKRPGIVVVHEWWGHNDYTRTRANMLAELGYTAIAVDMYGDGKVAEHPEDAGKFSGMVMSNIDMAKARFNAALAQLRAHPSVDPEKIAAIGYCFGGSVVLTMANAGMDLDVVAAFHSGVALPIMPTEDLKAKVLVCNGAADPFIPKASITAFKKAMDSVGAAYTYIAYEDAVHAFTSKGADSLGKKFNLPLAYQEKADTASWQELQQLLKNVF